MPVGTGIIVRCDLRGAGRARKPARVRHVMIEVREAIAGVLDNRTLAEMRDMSGGSALALLEDA